MADQNRPSDDSEFNGEINDPSGPFRSQLAPPTTSQRRENMCHENDSPLSQRISPPMRHISRFEKAILSLESQILTTATFDAPQNLALETRQHLATDELVPEEFDLSASVATAESEFDLETNNSETGIDSNLSPADTPSMPSESMPAASIPSTSQGEDRRQYPRHLSSGKVTVCLIEKDSLCYPPTLDWQMHSSQLRGTIMDISMNGVAIVLDQPIRVGTSVAMVLDWFHAAEEVQTRGHVIRSAEIQETSPSRLWLITVQLDRRLTFEQVRTLGHRLQSPMS